MRHRPAHRAGRQRWCEFMGSESKKRRCAPGLISSNIVIDEYLKSAYTSEYLYQLVCNVMETSY